MLVGVITAADIGMRAGQSQLRPRRFYAVQGKVEPTFVLRGDMKHLLRDARTQRQIDIAAIGAVGIQAVDRRADGRYRIEYTQKASFTAGRT